TRSKRDWSSDVCSSDLRRIIVPQLLRTPHSPLRTLYRLLRNPMAALWASSILGIKGITAAASPALAFVSASLRSAASSVARRVEIGRASCREGVESAGG